MKRFFAVLAVIIVATWAVALVWTPEEPYPERTTLFWSTDPNPARAAQLAPFMAMNPDLAVVVEPNTFDRTIVQCSTGIGPDLIETYSLSDMVAYAEAGILLDLTPYAEEYGFSPDTTYPGVYGSITYDGRQYRYPANVSSSVLLYNKRIFEEAGLPEPEDSMLWEDFIELVKPLTVRRERGAGFERFAMVMSQDRARDIHLQFGARFFTPDGTRCVLDSPESIAAIQFYHDLMYEHEIVPTPGAEAALAGEGGWGAGELRWFGTERGAVLWGARWMLVQLRTYPAMRDNIGVVLLPRPPGGESLSLAGSRGPGINVNSPHREEALRFLGYLASEEYSEVIAQLADALPPNRDYADEPERLMNPDYPWEDLDFHKTFVESIRLAQADESTPFVDAKFVERVWREALEYVENRLRTPEEALRDATRRINNRIARNIDQRPDLRERYEKRIALQAAEASGH